MSKYPGGIFDAFLDQANKNKDQFAVVDSDCTITYVELLTRINFLSAKLLQRICHAKTKIAILLEPSTDFIAVMFACLRTGFAYIPLNSSYPEPYLNNILREANINYLVTNKTAKKNSLFCQNIIDLTELELLPSNKDISFPLPLTNLTENAYVIFTSGSTGKPKGVMITHQGVVELINSTGPLYNIQKTDRISLGHSLAFDFSVWEITAALLNGALLIIPTAMQKQSLDIYCSFLIDNGITILNATPSMLYLLIDKFLSMPPEEQACLKLRLIVLGGEALKPTKLKNWFASPLSKKIEIFNMYGITEGTIHSTYIKVTEDMALSPASLIGVPLAHVNIDILDENGHKLHEINNVGELALIGGSVAKGYLNDPHSEKFYINEEGHWSFKTGDLVRRKPNGMLEYMGRKDRRFKVRGFRIDPIEIENALFLIQNIKNSVVLPRLNEHSQNEIIAFLEIKVDTGNISDIKNSLEKMLPRYMVPSKFIFLDAFPITINGKIDKEELFNLIKNENRVKEDLSYSPKQSPYLDKIVQVWKNILTIDSISLNQNFFDMGGNSLLLMKLHFDLQKNINQKITLMDLIEHPSINKFADFLQKMELIQSADPAKETNP